MSSAFIGSLFGWLLNFLKEILARPSIQVAITGAVKEKDTWKIKVSIRNSGDREDLLVVSHLNLEKKKEGLAYSRDQNSGNMAFSAPRQIPRRDTVEMALEFKVVWDNVPNNLTLKFQETNEIRIPIAENEVNNALFGTEYASYVLAAKGKRIEPQWFP